MACSTKCPSSRLRSTGWVSGASHNCAKSLASGSMRCSCAAYDTMVLPSPSLSTCRTLNRPSKPSNPIPRCFQLGRHEAVPRSDVAIPPLRNVGFVRQPLDAQGAGGVRSDEVGPHLLLHGQRQLVAVVVQRLDGEAHHGGVDGCGANRLAQGKAVPHRRLAAHVLHPCRLVAGPAGIGVAHPHAPRAMPAQCEASHQCRAVARRHDATWCY